ncbi:MAG: ADP,ATP carrier protein 1 [Chlamydiae bacterium]|nr:ADP,ATP carrier protein 1 [Chlamydiota bacterium]
MSQETAEFGKWRGFLWPVHGFELKKVLPMFLMLFLIVFNYTILRDTKDTLVVNEAGAAAIPFLKLWGVVPGAIIFMLIYSKLSNYLSKTALFYAAITPFIIFFALFALVIYPYKEYLEPIAMANAMENYFQWEGLNYFIACFRHWPVSIFYIASELWGSACVSLLFWGFANEITKVSESKRFYAVFLIGANVALLFSGPMIILSSWLTRNAPAGIDPYIQANNWLMGMVVISGLLTMYLYHYMNKSVLTDPQFVAKEEEKKKKKDKPKLGLFESFKYLAKSPYILCLATLVMAYGISINVVELTWKAQLKIQYPLKNDYQAFMGAFSFFTGLTTIFMLLFVSGNLIRKKGWGFAALVTPVVLLITGIAFFSFIIFRDNLSGMIASMGTNPVFLAVIIGAVQNIMSKSTKYSLFDPTKEMAYIPLDQEQKVKGKAAIDVVGARLGKSGGAFIQMVLILILGGITSSFIYFVATAFILVIAAWMSATMSLNHKFVALTSKKDQDKAPEATTEPALAPAK